MRDVRRDWWVLDLQRRDTEVKRRRREEPKNDKLWMSFQICFTWDSGLVTLLKDLGGGTGVTASSAKKQKKKSDHFVPHWGSQPVADSALSVQSVVSSAAALHHTAGKTALRLAGLVGVEQDLWRCRPDLTTCLSSARLLHFMTCCHCCTFQNSLETQQSFLSVLPDWCNSYFSVKMD